MTVKAPSWLIVLLYSCLGFSFPAAVTQYSMITDIIAAQLGCELRLVLLADSVRAVCVMGALFLSAFFHRRLGLRQTIGLGISLQVMSQLLLPLAISARSLPLLFLLKAMQGCNSVAFPLYIYTISRVVPKGAVGFSTALFNGSFVAGGGIGAWLTGMVLPRFGWAASFYLVGLLCLLLAVPAIAVTPREQPLPAQVPSAKNPAGRHKKPTLYAGILKNTKTWLLVLALSANTWVMQAITVDMAVFTGDLQFSHSFTGQLMLMVSMITILSSVTGGGLSDLMSRRTGSPLRVRAWLLAGGNVLSMLSGLCLIAVKPGSTALLAATVCLMAFGVSWAAGIFWALIPLVYNQKDAPAATAFCSGASNIVNPISPLVVGVVFGSAGLWGCGWLTCSIICGVSAVAAINIPRPRQMPAPRDKNTLDSSPT